MVPAGTTVRSGGGCPHPAPIMRVLVTGGAGYIGSHTAKALAARGHEPVVIDDLSTGHSGFVRWGPLVEADLADRAAVRSTLAAWSPQAVIHFAGSAYVGESMRRPRRYFANNSAATLGLLDLLLADGPRPFVFSSTCATYGIPESVPIGEDAPQRPVNPYGESKLFVEKVLRWYGELEGLPWAALRYFNAAGADQGGEIGEEHDPETHLIPRAMRAALGTAPPLEIYGTDYPTGDGTAVRDYIHVSDLAEAHVAALDLLAREGGGHALNLGTGSGHSVREVVRTIEEVAGRQVPATLAARRAGDPPALVADPGRAAAILGWKPRFSDLETIVATAWKWHSKRERP